MRGHQERTDVPATDPDPTQAHLRELFASVAERIAEMAEGALTFPPLEAGEHDESRLRLLCDRLGLTEAEVALLACAVAPSLDFRFARLFADTDRGLSRPSPRVDVLATLCGLSLWTPEVRDVLGEDGALRRARLWEIIGTGPLPTRTISVPDRLVDFLIGGSGVSLRVGRAAAAVAAVDVPEVGQVVQLIAAGAPLIWLRDPSGHTGASIGATAAATIGLAPVVIDLELIPKGAAAGAGSEGGSEGGSGDLHRVVDDAIREAVLSDGAIVICGLDPARDAALISTLGRQPCPLVLVSVEAWDPSRFAVVASQVTVRPLDAVVRRNVWSAALIEAGIAVNDEELLDLSTLRVGPGQISVAVATATTLAIARGDIPSAIHARLGALSYGAGKLERLATRIEPRATFDDLILPQMLLDDLRSIPGWMRTRHIVRSEWGMDRGARSARGITCLFAGPSGTGKTLAAEVLAHSLGVELFVIDLSQIVDKYIGETEKNLERVFHDAEGVNGVLLFDEADALFGKRSEVQSAHDRHANVEVAYLLQRMERYDGIAVLTTNLRNNLDEAFTRRLDVILSFPEPGAADRLALWQRHLPSTVPFSTDVDLAVLAEHLVVTGGIIRNITMVAAHAAAIAGSPVSMTNLVEASAREYRKVGRLFNIAALRRWVVE